MRRALVTLAVVLLVLVPAAAQAGEYDLPSGSCSSFIGVEGLYAEGSDFSVLCPNIDRWEIITPPQHGTVVITREFMPWVGQEMWHIVFTWSPGTAVGTTDSYSYRLHDGDRATAVLVRRLKLLPPLTVTAPRPAVKPPALTVRRLGSSRHRLRLATSCDVACAVGATVTARGKVVGRAGSATAGTLTVPLTRGARKRRLVATVTALAVSGATDTWRLEIPPR